MKPTKSAMARAARERGERTFMATCIRHGEQSHYASTRACLLCQSERNAPKNAAAAERYRSDPEYRARWRERSTTARRKRRKDAEYREAENAKEREWRSHRFTNNAEFRGRKREGVAANNWRKATGGNMTGWYGLEREALQQKYGECPEGFDMDHAIPKIAKAVQGKQVASGLHCWANVIQTPRAVNNMKRTQFNPDNNRLQRPANQFPGGAFDPTPTEPEWSLIKAAAEDLKSVVNIDGVEYVADVIPGTPVEVCLAVLREALEREALAYEDHVAMIEQKLPEC
ncbi:hypothetical protein [Paraburkholderia youngii]|uniref:hypothetical protein n=1 Tax=Paraburkholderia youngii TaxID=2782701 RepID=UPI003D21C3ED